MKSLIVALLFLIPHPAKAQDRLWVSNSLEAGYGNVYVSEKVTFKKGTYDKNSLGLGLKFRFSDIASYKTYYSLENCRKNNWLANHVFGFAIGIRFR